MGIEDMCNDVVSLEKADGSIIQNIKAVVQPRKIIIPDGKLPLEKNDKLYRELPNGLVEKYLVIDRGYIAGHHNIESFYEASVRKETTITKGQYQNIVNIFNLQGANSKVNVDSIDMSTNIVNDDSDIFKGITNALNRLADDHLREKSLILAKELEENQGGDKFIDKYQEFISLLANQITVIAPFIPALTSMIPH